MKYLPIRTGASNELSCGSPMSSFRRPSILIVDSDTDSLFALAQMVNSFKIENAEIQLLTALSAQRALNLANHVTIDLVISDIQLLDMAGENLIDTIRALTGCFQLPSDLQDSCVYPVEYPSKVWKKRWIANIIFVRSVQKISLVFKSNLRYKLRLDYKLCLLCNYSPSPNIFNLVLSTTKCIGPDLYNFERSGSFTRELPRERVE